MSAGPRGEFIIDAGKFYDGVDQHAAPIGLRLIGSREGALKEVSQGAHGRMRLPRVIEKRVGPLREEIEAIDEQAALVEKRCIEAAAAYAHRIKQIRQRRRLIPRLPEKHHRALARQSNVELNRPSHSDVMDRSVHHHKRLGQQRECTAITRGNAVRFRVGATCRANLKDETGMPWATTAD
ncbi:MAG: hypothetical protein ABMA14_03205 [Hyphomonadaceae bacterium]